MHSRQRLNKHLWLEIHRTMDKESYFRVVVNKRDVIVYETEYFDSKKSCE